MQAMQLAFIGSGSRLKNPRLQTNAVAGFWRVTGSPAAINICRPYAVLATAVNKAPNCRTKRR